MNEPLELFRSLVGRLEAGRPCALCAVVNTRGSTPQTTGAMLVVHANGETEGTIGGGCVEAEVRRRALELLGSVRETQQPESDPSRCTHPTGLLRFQLDENFGWDDSLICGGQMEVAVVCLSDVSQAAQFREAAARIARQEPARVALRIADEGKTVEYRLHVEPTPTLLIAGAGHVGAALAQLAAGLGFRAVVFDDREDLLSPDRLPPPIETVAGDIETQLRQWPIDANTYVAVVTRGHAHDARALQAVVGSAAKYVGMIGSRRKIQAVFEELESRGLQRARLERVHSPIGLRIGAVTVPEIAVSIAAELIAVRRAESRPAVEGPFEAEETLV